VSFLPPRKDAVRKIAQKRREGNALIRGSGNNPIRKKENQRDRRMSKKIWREGTH